MQIVHEVLSILFCRERSLNKVRKTDRLISDIDSCNLLVNHHNSVRVRPVDGVLLAEYDLELTNN